MPDPPAQAKILYVDDDPSLRQTIPLAFEQQDMLVRTASNGLKGVELALEWLPDLILMDLMMPVMDGFRATEILRADPRTQQIIIVGFSALSDPSTPDKVKTAGMNGFIAKPISLLKLVQILSAYLRSET